jgi:hypothetical protein
MYLTFPNSYAGLGDQQTAQLGVQVGAAAASAGASAALAAGLISASAVPVIGAAVAAVALAVTLLVKNSGCGQTCIETSQWANQAEKALQQNLAAYFALPVPRAQSNQTLALQTFDQIWGALTGPNNCGNPAVGNAGVRCISDRQAGACTYKSDGVSRIAGAPAVPAGQCWNWFNGYRDPSANDPNVVPDSTLQALTTDTGLPSLLQSAGISSSYAVPILIGGGLLLLLAVMQ